MSKRCVIISGGEPSTITPLREGDYVIACDKGYSYAAAQGIKPDLLVSDFDSYDGAVDSSVPIERFRSEKDDTDTMIAVRYAVEHGFEEIKLFCALGGRLDHSLANLQSLVYAQVHGLRASLEAEDTRIYTLQKGSLRLARLPGWSLSVFAAQDRCAGVSITGAKYPLRNAELTCSFPLGVSNAWADDAAEISVEEGVLLIVLSKM